MSLTRGIKSSRISSNDIGDVIDTIRIAVPERRIDNEGKQSPGELEVASFTAMDGSRIVRIYDPLTMQNVDYQIGTRGIVLLNPKKLDDRVSRLGVAVHSVDGALFAAGYSYNSQTKMYKKA